MKILPSDLTKFSPSGNGVYGYDSLPESPLRGGPTQEANGGVIYFDDIKSKDDFMGMMRVLHVINPFHVKPRVDYAVFRADSEKPGEDGFVSQLRFVSKFGLRYLFNAITEKEYDKFPTQAHSIADAMWEFMEEEKKRWGTYFGDCKLAGMFGGDGEYAREALSFGLMVENDYHSVYRIWSRAWLVTK